MKRSLSNWTAAGLVALLTSSAGAQNSWSLVHQGQKPLNAVAHGGGQFVVVGDSGAVLTSPTGEEWTPRTIPPSTNVSLQAVAYGDGIWIAGGMSTHPLRSLDGIQWTQVPSGPTQITSLVHGNGMFVGTGSGRLWASANGLDWTSINPGSLVADRVLCWGGGRFVAFSRLDGVQHILVSTNGTDWITKPSPPEQSLYRIGYGAGTFLAIGTSRNTTYVSHDLEAWTPAGITQVVRASGIAHGLGSFVVVGSGNPEMTVDGSIWSPGEALDSGPARAVVFANDAFVAVGFNGSIFRTDTLLTVRMRTPGNLSVVGPGGGRVGIQARDSLGAGSAWMPVGQLTLGPNGATWSDPETPLRAERWYRMVGF